MSGHIPKSLTWDGMGLDWIGYGVVVVVIVVGVPFLPILNKQSNNIKVKVNFREPFYFYFYF